MSEIKLQWVENIILGINIPDVSGYALVRDGVVESEPIPRYFNDAIGDLFNQLAAKNKEIERLKETWKYNKLKKIDNEIEKLKGELTEANKELSTAYIDVNNLRNAVAKVKCLFRDEKERAEKAEAELAKVKIAAEKAEWMREGTVREFETLRREAREIKAENAALRERMKPIKEVYETYYVSCDPLDPGWQAIRRAVEGK